MGKQMTEMLKGTLEGIVLAILAAQPAYGYEITARLREQGFSDLVEGTVYALLVRIEQRGFVDVEKVPSEKGPPRKVYSLNAQGREQLEEFWRTWSFLAERIEQLHTAHAQERTDMAAKWIETLTGSLEQKKQYKQYKARIDALPEPYRTRREGVPAVLHVLRGHLRRRHPHHDVRRLRRPLGARRRRRHAGARDRRRRPGRVRRDVRPGLHRQAVDRQGARPPDQGDRRRGAEGADDDHRQPPSACRASRSRSRTCTCCGASTSTCARGASSRCSARTAPARPRWCGSCRRC